MQIKTTCFIIAATALIGCGTETGNGPSNSTTDDHEDRAAIFNDLVSRYRQAHQTKDQDTLFGLVYWSQAEDKIQAMAKASLQEDLTRQLASVEVVALSDDDITQYTLKGVRYETTLPAAGKLQVKFETESGGSIVTASGYLVGIKDGRAFIVTSQKADPQ